MFHKPDEEVSGRNWRWSCGRAPGGEQFGLGSVLPDQQVRGAADVEVRDHAAGPPVDWSGLRGANSMAIMTISGVKRS